jgi:hypothetical protein
MFAIVRLRSEPWDEDPDTEAVCALLVANGGTDGDSARSDAGGEANRIEAGLLRIWHLLLRIRCARIEWSISHSYGRFRHILGLSPGSGRTCIRSVCTRPRFGLEIPGTYGLTKRPP